LSTASPIKKLKKKILIQVALIVLAVFAVIIMVTGTLIYSESKNIYLQAKNEMIIGDLDEIRYDIMRMHNLPWVLEYAREHTRELDTAVRDYNYVSGESFDTAVAFYMDHGYRDLSEPIVDPALDESLRQASDEVQLAVAAYNFSTLVDSLYISQFQANYDRVYCLDVSEENLGFVYCAMDKQDPDHYSVGDRMGYTDSRHPALEQILSGETLVENQGAAFEISRVDGSNMDFYVGYLPVTVDGKICCTICISFDFSPFRSSFMPYIVRILVIGAVIMLLFAGLLLIFLHHSAISPLRIIQKGVRRYSIDKDSAAITAEMDKITANNEFGALSDDIAALAREIDRYTSENIRLASEKEKVASELAFAAKIQSDMLPQDFPANSRFELYAAMNPAKEVGGDFYDFFFIDDDTLALVIADVSGKGVPASLFMMRSMIMIRNIALHNPNPAAVLSAVNLQLCTNNESSMFVTAWLGIVDLTTGHMRAANAGHEYPIIKNPGGEYQVLKDKHSFVMGANELIRYKEYELQLSPGSKLFLYTDGAPEAQDAAGEMFTVERICDALNRSSDAAPHILLDDVTAAIGAFVQDAEQFDDTTMMSFFYLGGEDSPADNATESKE
jgi:serine phosphatase RsbU (regulator of sigma subunit)